MELHGVTETVHLRKRHRDSRCWAMLMMSEQVPVADVDVLDDGEALDLWRQRRR